MDGDAYGREVMRHKDRLHTYALWMLRDAEEARDVAQEALLRLWEHRGQVHNGATKTWLMRTAYRLCIDRLRTNSTRPQVSLANLSAHSADFRPGPEHNAMLSDLRGAIGRALASLSPRDRAVILMREMHDMTYEQMAEAMEMPLGTLKAALHRARDRLREALIGAGVTP